ncbi:MAG: AEC family transporter [Oscillospiraceae bacterium]|nr:AEC family transporter [Oscillospiraceae bacterium]
MENLIFSLNATIPVFLVMVVGWILRQRGMLTDGFCSAAEKFNFQVTLPALLFKDISGINIKEAFDLRYTLFCAGATTLCFLGAWIGARLFMKDKYSVGAFVQACYRGSAAVLGIAFIQNIYGSSGMAPMMIVSSVPLFNIYAVLVLVLENPENKGGGSAAIKKAVIGVCKNPIIWGILIGAVFSLLQWQLPVMLSKTVGSLAAMATPLALIVVGAGFEGMAALKKVRPTLIASLVKLVIQPLIFLPIAAWMGFTTDKMIAVLVMLAAPTTPSCYIMAKNMNGDHVLTSSVVVTTTLLSAFTLTFWIWALRTAGLL